MSHGGTDGTRAIDVSLWLWLVAVLAFLYLPIATVLGASFNTGRFLLIWDGVGTTAYGEALANQGIRQAIGLSLRVAAVCALVSVLLGGLAGVAMVRYPGGWTRVYGLVLLLILVAPEIVVAIAYLVFFVRLGLVWGLARLVIAHSIFGSAVVTLLVQAQLKRLDPVYEEAAADLGASPLRAFRDVTLPLMRPALIAGGLLAFTFSLDDVVIASFVSTAGSTTLPAYIFSSLRTGLRTELAAVASMALALTMAVLAGLALLARRQPGPSAWS